MSVYQTESGWILETRETAYVLGNLNGRYITHLYWGPRLPSRHDYPLPVEPSGWGSFNGPAHVLQEEYPAHGGVKFTEPCLKTVFHDGVRDTDLVYDRCELQENTLSIHLKDVYYPLTVTLHYTVHFEHDLIERRAQICNTGKEPVQLDRMWSAQWHFPTDRNYRMTHLHGRWCDEMSRCSELLTPGVKMLESRRITTGHQHHPWFAVDDSRSTETTGGVWFGVLAYSGNWKLAAEVTDCNMTRISMGINDWDSCWILAAGESFETPASIAGYSGNGFGGASRRLHRYIRQEVLPHGTVLRKVLYNSWETTQFNVDEASQAALAETAAGLGVELFVMDDGWFHNRPDDKSGLGDWWADRKKFPDGLAPLIKRVNDAGMDFGLWLEPEMTNPDSELYRAHPDWVIHFPTRERTESRNQLILNMGRTDVQDYLIGVIDRLLTEHNIAYIKWDMNRNASQPGWPAAPRDQREVWIRYTQGLFRVWETLQQRHPRVIWQSCSGGGGRADLQVLRVADQIWPSDNTAPASRLKIQEGFSYVLPANTLENWVTDTGGKQYSIAFRMHVSMCGLLGIGANLSKWNEAERTEAARWIAYYKQIRHIVQQGGQYRLYSSPCFAFSAVQYMTEDGSEGVVFAFRTRLPGEKALPRIYLQGLLPEAEYAVEGFKTVRSGAAWMQDGISLCLADFESTVRKIRRTECEVRSFPHGSD